MSRVGRGLQLSAHCGAAPPWVVTLAFLVGCGGGDPVGKDRFGDSPGGGGGADVGTGGGAGGSLDPTGGSTATSTSSSSGGGPKQVQHCFDTSLDVFPLELTEGDGEFNGHGPSVTLTVDAEFDAPSSIRVTACVDMKETQSDWTTGHACKSKSFTVGGLLSVQEDPFEASYIDNDHEFDTIESSDVFDPSAVVKSAGCQGDRVGNDICNDSGCARCKIDLGCIQAQVAQ